MSRHQLDKEIQADWQTAEDYEIDLAALMATVNGIYKGNKIHPQVSARYSLEIAICGRLLTDMAKQHGGT